MRVMALVLLVVSTVSATTINSPSIAAQFSNGPLIGLTSGPAVTISNTMNSNLFNGTLCFGGYCPGELKAGLGPDFQVNDPIQFKTTGATITCQGTCGSFVFSMDASYTATGESTVPVYVKLDGTAPAGFLVDINADVFIVNTHLRLSNQTVVSSPKGTINDSFSLGSMHIHTGDRVNITGTLAFSGLPDRTTFSLPNSFTIQLGDAPEPVTLGLLGSGLLALGLFRRHLQGR